MLKLGSAAGTMGGLPGVEVVRDGRGQIALFYLFERSRQCQAPIGPLVDGTWHVRPFLDCHCIIEGGAQQRARCFRQSLVSGLDDLRGWAVVAPRRTIR